ncbi:MAG: 5-oxoprolinase [Magnetovibrio sp.]|nr:5-oxoprolinase [Magnetovibrio sp.]
MNKNKKFEKTIGRDFDPIEMEIFSNRLMAITEDMGNQLVRSSFSTNIKERRDCSVGLFDKFGRCICQGSNMPLHLGSLLGSTNAVLERYSIEEMSEGDAFICNDTYLANGTHLPDISIVTPVFLNGSVQFFTANVGHHSDVGGRVPGSISGSSKTIFEEGIRIPVIRIARRGNIDADLLNLIVNNTREPLERELDFRVQIATNERGAAMLEELARQHGLSQIENAINDLIDYTQTRVRNRISEIKDGEYSFTRHMDDDGFMGELVHIKVTIRIEGEAITIDCSGSSPQARGALNLTSSGLNAAAYYAVKSILDPQLLPNSGLFDSIKVFSPSGTILNPEFPAAIGARSITANKVAGAIFGAFEEILPKERLMAASHDSVPVITFSGQRERGQDTYVYLESIGGGNGARHNRDGMDGVQVHTTNSTNLPVESLESEYNLLVDEYSLVEDSGGAGKHRGGCGIARQIRALGENITFSARSDNHVTTAPGIFGGSSGDIARLIRNYGTDKETALDSKVSVLELKLGESVRMETAGGGGFGSPKNRPLEKLRLDLISEKISPTFAEKNYGAAMVRDALSIDTRQLWK